MKHQLISVIINSQLIMLDIEKDKYYIFEREAFSAPMQESIYVKNIESADKIISAALTQGVFRRYDEYVGIGPYSWEGASSYRRATRIDRKVFLKVLFFIITNLFRITRVKILDIYRSKNQSFDEREAAEKDIEFANQVFRAIETVARLLPTKMKCLQYSFVCSEILRSVGIPHRFCLGIQTFSFFSHAWIEVDGKVIGDDPRVQGLAIMLRI